jgi:transcriptional regulator with XRE-family HTH domain/SOS-response transcriptional repressor LexA
MEWNLESFQNNLKTARKDKGWRVEDLAKVLNQKVPTVRAWESRTVPSLSLVPQISQVLDCSPAWLAFNVPPRNANLALELSTLLAKIEETPGLQEIITNYTKLDNTNRELYLGLMKRLSTNALEVQAGVPPLGTEIAVDRDLNVKTLTPNKIQRTGDGALIAGEELSRLKPIESGKKRKKNHREKMMKFHLVKRPGQQGEPMPIWVGLAAGPGKELQRCSEYKYYRELPYWKGHHSMVVSGDSMADTILPNDLIVVKELNGAEGVVLESLQNGDMKTPLQVIQNYIRNDDICVLSINEEEPTLKRVLIRGNNDWQMTITADNPNAFEPVSITKTDKVRFYAKLIALCDPEDPDRKGKSYVPGK